MVDELSGLGKYFFFLLALEFVFGVYRGRSTFTALDSINSLSTLALSSSMRLLMFPVELAIYFLVYENFRIFTIEETAIAFVTAFFVYDLCYYWRHRVGHEVNLFWAVHSVHHQSTEYNYTTSFRQRSFSFLTDWLFTLPMALAGFSPKAMIIGSAGNLAYQFWLHTRHVGRTPILDKVIVTPSLHRVHHARNDVYLDKNYGGFLILWDKIFGTFATERIDTPVDYGTVAPLRSHNAVYANFQVFHMIWHSMMLRTGFIHRLAVLFEAPSQLSVPSSAISAPLGQPTRSAFLYAVMLFLTSLGAVFWATNNFYDAPLAPMSLFVLYIWASIAEVGLLLNRVGTNAILGIELVRYMSLGCLVVFG